MAAMPHLLFSSPLSSVSLLSDFSTAFFYLSRRPYSSPCSDPAAAASPRLASPRLGALPPERRAPAGTPSSSPERRGILVVACAVGEEVGGDAAGLRVLLALSVSGSDRIGGDLILSMTNVDQSQVESPSLSDSCSPVVFDCFSSIPRVKSLAWGQCYDASSQLEDSIFNEVLVVSDDDSITLHGFCHSYKSTLTDNSKLDTGDLHGEWKEWRPTQCSVPEDDEAGTKNSFRSFLTTISGSVSDGKYQAKFPLKSSLPHSAEVVSFSIYDITLSFIKFWSSNYPSKTWMQNDTKSQQGFLGHVPTTETSCNCQWECLKVLPSSSGYLIGLVLIRNEPVSCEVHQRNMKDILVVVIELNQWGIQWNFVADLQNVYDGAVPNQQWVDFQLSDDFLACLNSGGFVVIWNVRTCNIAASFSVLERCRTDIDIPMGSITPTVKTSDGENIYIGNHARRMFKRLVLASYSLVLAVVDEVGVIYLFYAKDILDFKTSMHGNFHPPSMFYCGDSFAAWEAAGHDIGSVTFCCHRSVQQLVYDFSERDNPGVVRPRKRRKHCSSNENQVHSWPSGFSTTTPMKDGLAYPDTMAVSNPLRRVILPPCRLQENIISLSPFGLTRIFKSHNADGNKHFRIVHTNFLMASLHLDERDIDASFLKRSSFQKDSTFTGECVLCSFQGYVYLITQDSLSVVLPSISVSSFSSHNNGIKFWQPTSAGGSACDALNLSSVNRPETRWKPWQIEVLDRALLYEGPAFADRLCWENGWDLKFSRLRWLQLALHYTKISDLEQLMVLAVRFATRMIKCYGLLKQNKDAPDNSVKLHEMAFLLGVIRSIQSRISAKNQNSIRMGDDKNSSKIGAEVSLNTSLPIVVVDGVSAGQSGGIESRDRQESTPAMFELVSGSNGQLALTPVESSISATMHHAIDTDQVVIPSTQGNIKDMMNRWETNNLDLRTVVKEALQSGRLPLAVLQLQLLRQRESFSNDPEDVFSEVHEIGRSIVYDLLMKGETGLAVATLERLGDDIESDLRQLMQGTVRRLLRRQIAEEMKKRGYMSSNEWKMLEIISLIEQFYPSSSFWDTYLGRENVIHDAAKIVTLPGEDKPVLVLDIHNHCPIECGDVDGAVIGSWANVNDYTNLKEFSESNLSDGYWACAAIWSDAWDQRTVDRIILDQPCHAHAYAHFSWESQFEYFVAHNDVLEVCKLLDSIPDSVLLEGILRVNVDNSQATYNTLSDVATHDYKMYLFDSEEIEPVCMEIPHVKVFRSLCNHESTSWMRMIMLQELAKKHIFMKEYWQSTTEIIPILARAGMLVNTSELCSDVLHGAYHQDCDGALHKLVLRFCVQYNTPNLLDLYLDYCNLALEKDSIPLLKEATGDCKWAQWLLFSRVKGYEYEASFCNALWNLSQEMVRHNNLAAIEIDEILYTVDDMAERIGEMSALATLMYASTPIQKSICTGSVNRNRGVSSQCTLENLSPHLQQFPTLWKTLLSSCFGQDGYGCLNCSPTNGYSEANALSLEASIQKSVEEELYSSLEEKDLRVEHHLHRGRALAAFRHLLGKRASQLKSANASQVISVQSSVQADVQLILAPLSQTERPILLSVAPLAITNFEDSTLVASCTFLLELCGLCANMLRLDIAALQRISSYYKSFQQNKQCDLSSPRSPGLHVLSHGADLAPTLARTLAEDYIQSDHLHVLEQKQPSKAPKREHSSQPLKAILHHLEKASLPVLEEGRTCGFWLLNGIGDASLYRTQQNEASQHWNLVTEFCQAHHLPLSTKYLALLANDNDWVGFLTEAQVSGFPIEVVIEVAAKEIRDSRLRTHILTILKNMMSARRKSSSNVSSGSDSSLFAVDGDNSMELFSVLAVCEKQKNPGEALLNKAKQMQWSLLAMIASCFSDVTPLSCLSVWLDITASREMSLIKVDDISSKIAKNVGSAVEATNKLPSMSRNVEYRYNRKNPKRRRFLEASQESFTSGFSSCGPSPTATPNFPNFDVQQKILKPISEETKIPVDIDERFASLSSMVAVLCEQQLFLPLLRAFEMFLPSCSLLPFIRSLQAFCQMRLSEASAHLASFSARLKDETSHAQLNSSKEESAMAGWVAVTVVKAADAVLSTCPSIYEKRCLLQLLAVVDFSDGGSSAAYFRRGYWKIILAEPSVCKDGDTYKWNDSMDDASLLASLEKDGRWEEARTWARQLESSDVAWESTFDHVTESQAEAMVAEWKEFLWDIPQERAALWSHCQSLFMKYSLPPLQAGSFFLKHAEAVGEEIPARELHEILLLSLQWLSGTMTNSSPVYPLHLLRDIETRVWLLAVESESQCKADGEYAPSSVTQNLATGNNTNIIEQTADVITKIDNSMSSPRMRITERNGIRDNNTPSFHQHLQLFESNGEGVHNTRARRRSKTNTLLRRVAKDSVESSINDSGDNSNSFNSSKIAGQARSLLSEEEFAKMEVSLSGWEQNVRPVDMEKAVLSLLEFGQITAATQLQQKLSPSYVPEELVLVDIALRVANNSSNGEISLSCFDPEALSILQSLGSNTTDPSEVMEKLAMKCGEGRGRALVRRIAAVVQTAKVLGLPFSEAFKKQPIELLQLLSLKAQDSFDEAKFLVETHTMPASSIARILADSFLKGLLAAHRGGYLDSQKEEGPAPLLWRSSDFLKWAKLCPSEPEIGHALMRLVMTGHEVPHACEVVELLILSYHFYMSSSCLDGVDVLVTFAANRVESYVSEGDFSCLARLITGVSNFHSLSFILSILIENGQLELLLQKYSATDSATGAPASVRGFRMAVITSLKHFIPSDDDALSLVYKHFDMKHEAASLLESRAEQYMNSWLSRYDKERRNDELLEAMHHLVEMAEVLSTIDAGQRTHRACARASLLSLQIRIPDLLWIGLSETNARRIFVEQSRFQEALIVAEAYNINQPMEWAPVFWNQMLKPDLIEQFVAEFVLVLPLQPPMLLELARFYRAEVAARGDQSHFSVWLSPGGLPAEWVKHLGRSFRSLLRRTRDMRLRLQLATLATGFSDVLDACNSVLDKVPENAGPLILRKGHGGTYLPLM
uniref:Spatacsin C-terminal domain-containing protein n=1 Tax=Oryza glumipatula TaxID=40148 RepID=A0A0D9Y480_9ORYZ